MIFGALAAIAGYAPVFSIMCESMLSEVWLVIFCVIGGGFANASAPPRLGSPADTPPT